MQQENNPKIMISLYIGMVVAIGMIVTGVSGLASLKAEKAGKKVIEKLEKSLPEDFQIKYDKISANIFQQAIVFKEFKIVKKSNPKKYLRIRKIILCAGKIQEDIPLSGKIILKGISAKGFDIPLAFKQNKEHAMYVPAAFKKPNIPDINQKMEQYIKEYFKGAELSTAFIYDLKDKKNTLIVKEFSIEYDKFVNFNLALSLSNISFDDIKQIVNSEKKEQLIRMQLLKMKPVELDCSICIDLDKLDLKEIVQAAGIKGPAMEAVIKAGLPKYFRIFYNQNVYANARKKVYDLKDISIGFEPGLIFSLQFIVKNIDFNNIFNLQNAEIPFFKFVIKDRQGIQTAMKINANIAGKSEEQISEELKQNFDGLAQLYGLKTILGDKVKILKDFLFTNKDSITIRNRKGSIIKLNQLLLFNPRMAEKMLQTSFVLE